MTQRPNSSDGGNSDDALPAEFARWAADQDAGPGLDLDALHAELAGKLAAERGVAGWLRSRPTPLRAALAGVAIAFLVVATMALWLRVDFELYPWARMRSGTSR